MGWWKGDGNTLDSSVFGNNGVAINIGYTNGIVGQAFACDPENYPYGTYNAVDVPDSPAYILTNALTIEGWIRPRGDGYCILSRGDNRTGLDPYVLSMQGNHTLDFFIEDGVGNTAFVGTDLNYNQWYYVAATWDGSTGTMSIYTNGVLAGQTVTDVRPLGELIPEDSPGVGIGNVNDGFNNFPFTGDIDEISLYNRALSAAEIQAIYNAGSAGKCPIAAPTCVSPPPGLISWWPGEGNASDIAGTNNGLLENVTFTNGEVGQAFVFNGTSSYVRVPASSSLSVGLDGGFTIELWINPANPNSVQPILEWNNNNGQLSGTGVQLWLTAGGPDELHANVLDTEGNNHHMGANNVMTTNNFQHIALTYDKATGVAVLYRNGVAVATQSLGSITPQTSFDLYMGLRPSGQFSDIYFQGILDEVSLYSRALSASEIQAIYNAGSAGKCPITAPTCVSPPSGLISWWPGEGNASDIAGTNNGLLENVTFTNGEVGQAFVFNGTNSGIRIPANASLNVGLGNGFTLEAWVNPSALQYGGFLPPSMFEWNSGSGSGDASVGVQFNLSGVGIGSLAGQVQDTTATHRDIYSAPGIMVTNVFQHVALTYDKTTGMAVLYRNGVVVATTNLGVFTPQTSFDLYLGERVAGPFAPFYFEGMIDEPSVYNRALSSNEIASIYNAGSAGKCAGPLLPGITVPPVNQTTVEGSDVVLSVVASGTGPLSYQWSFNGTNIFGATNATLTLTNLHPNQSGSYAVTITTPYGTITSSSAIVTVMARNILVYKYSGAEKITTAGQAFAYGYSGQMFFIPDSTNGTFVGWGTIKGKKQYWVNPLSDYLLITIPGASNQIFTVLGRAGQGIDTNGYPHIWSYLHKGKNTPLTIGQKMYFSFPNTFAADATHVYPDSQTGNMVLSESSSIYTFVPQSTQTANNTGQTMTDLVNALTRSLASQGYQIE